MTDSGKREGVQGAPGAGHPGRWRGLAVAGYGCGDQTAFFQGAWVRPQIGLEMAMSMSRAKIAKPS